ncbi:MAG: hypothetical protein ACOWWH_00965 [Eubacteriaceae bacterium]
MAIKKKKILYKLVLFLIFTSIIVSQVNIKTIGAEEQKIFVKVYPECTYSQTYTSVGKNWTFMFISIYNDPDNSSIPVCNASLFIQVNNSKNEEIEVLEIKTTQSGISSFNYSSSVPEILTFTPIMLITENKSKYVSTILDETDFNCLASESITGWWDTFDVSIVNFSPITYGTAIVEINVNYLLIPESGINFSERSTCLNKTFLQKTANNISVTINSEAVEQTKDGEFNATFFTFLPITYVIVEVSKEGWSSTVRAFSFVNSANEFIWQLALLFCLIVFSGILVFKFISIKKNGKVFVSRKNFSFFNAIFLTLNSGITFYWGLVWLSGTLIGFGWHIYVVISFPTIIIGLVGAIFSLKRKLQPFVIASNLIPMILFSVGVVSSHEIYNLQIPWLMLIPSFVSSIISSYLACNADYRK